MRRFGWVVGLTLCSLVASMDGEAQETPSTLVPTDVTVQAESPEPPEPPDNALHDAYERFGRRVASPAVFEAFYGTTIWEPTLVAADGELTTRGEVLIEALRSVIERNMLDTSELGITTANTAAERLEDAEGDEDREAAAARLEIALTDVLLRVALELRYEHDAAVPDVVVDRRAWRREALVALLSVPTDELDDAIADLPPSYAAYERLADAIERYRQVQANGGWPELSSEVEAGSPAELVIPLRERLALEGYIADVSTPEWDDGLAQAVLRYQAAHQIRHPLDRVGRQTLNILNVPVRTRIGSMVANLDRMRDSARDPDGLGDIVHVNVGGFRIEVWSSNELLFSSRVIVGDIEDEDGHETRRWQTPLFVDEMERIDLNPTWYIPPSIEREVRLDPEIGIIRRGDQMLQLPGPNNVLGRVKFVFPNNDSIYRHDTLYPALFDRAVRTFSHGCIRLDRPLELATILISRDQNRDPVEVATWIAGILETTETEVVTLQRTIPVALEYYTVWPADDGVVEFYGDVYELMRQAERSARGRTPQVLLPEVD